MGAITWGWGFGPGPIYFFVGSDNSMFWIVLISLFVFLFPFRSPSAKPRHVLNVYFGVPGSGKTTYAAYLTKQCLRESWVIRLCRRWPDNKFCKRIVEGKFFRRPMSVFSNVPITGAYKLDPRKDIGHYMIADGKVIVDEAGIEYNNRFFKFFPPEAIYFYKYHRHYQTSVDVFSQSYDDMDVTLRRLAQAYYVVRRSLVPFCVTTRLIRRKVGVDDQTHQISDLYSMGYPFFDTRRVFSPPLWKMFNSYSRKELPAKEWEKW